MNEQKNLAKTAEGAGALQTEPIREERYSTFIPQVDIIEKKDCIVILADMPGVSREGVEAIMEEGILTIDGKVNMPEETAMAVDTCECEPGNFHRSFAVGEGLDPENIEASIKDGVLRVRIPKSEKYKPKKIEIK